MFDRRATSRAGTLSDTCRIQLGKILEEAGAQNEDVALLARAEGVEKMRRFLNAIRKKPPRSTLVSATVGTDLCITPVDREVFLQEHARNVIHRQREIANRLLQTLLVDGADVRIQVDDIEALCGMEKTTGGRSPALMRRIIVELMLSLRKG